MFYNQEHDILNSVSKHLAYRITHNTGIHQVGRYEKPKVLTTQCREEDVFHFYYENYCVNQLICHFKQLFKLLIFVVATSRAPEHR